VSPDAAGRYHDHPGDEPDNPASKRGREPEFDGGKRSGGSIDDQANDQPGDAAPDTGRESGDTRPPSKQRHAPYRNGEPVHMPHYRMCGSATGRRDASGTRACATSRAVTSCLASDPGTRSAGR